MPAPFLQESRISNFCHRYNSAVADPGEGPGAAALYFWTKRRPAPLPPSPPFLISRSGSATIPNIVFFPNPVSVPKFSRISLPGYVALKSRILLTCPEIPHRILFKSGIPGKSFQSLKKRIVPDFSETFVNV